VLGGHLAEVEAQLLRRLGCIFARQVHRQQGAGRRERYHRLVVVGVHVLGAELHVGERLRWLVAPGRV